MDSLGSCQGPFMVLSCQCPVRVPLRFPKVSIIVQLCLVSVQLGFQLGSRKSFSSYLFEPSQDFPRGSCRVLVLSDIFRDMLGYCLDPFKGRQGPVSVLKDSLRNPVMLTVMVMLGSHQGLVRVLNNNNIGGSIRVLFGSSWNLIGVILRSCQGTPRIPLGSNQGPVRVQLESNQGLVRIPFESFQRLVRVP